MGSIFQIALPVHKGKHIEVVKYKKTTSGVELQVKHNVPTSSGKQLRWVQTVTENGSFYKGCGFRTAVDPFSPTGTVALPGVRGVCKADDLKPFYWTDAEFAGGHGPYFYDKPAELPPASGRSWIQFILALTEVTGKNVHHLIAIAWGFDRLSGGAVRVAPIRKATLMEMKAHGRALKHMYPAYSYT
ncbi:MAG: hypothetical protein L0Z73_10535 [Gammaproteobacteria bacterium]|nr:hypothetical protein [Gammaproteobacteria bacterium]